MEEWEKWIPDHLQSDDYELREITQTKDSVQICFVGDRLLVTVIYEAEFLCMRSSDESDRWKTVDAVLHQKGGTFFKCWLTYKVYHSNFIKWFNEENYGAYSPDEVMHCAFVTPNDIVEVLSLSEPKVEVRLRFAT